MTENIQPDSWEGVLWVIFRTIALYGFTLLIVRLGSRRILTKATPFDFVVSIMIGSVMGKAMLDQSLVKAAVIVGPLLLALHWLFAFIAYHTDWFGKFVKGGRVLLVRDGEIQKEGMDHMKLTPKDLEQEIHLKTGTTGLSNIKRAYMERSGEISIIHKEHKPRVFTVSVAEGVQTIRVEIPE